MTRKNLNTLQAFRGVAAILVLLFHATGILGEAFNTTYLWGIFELVGSYGVDFFFVLSGFIIFYAHSGDIGSRRIMPYLRKRFTRVYPVYWAVTIPVIALIFIFPDVGTHETDFLNIFRSLILFPDVTPPLLGVAWTLVREVLFYVIFGLVLIQLKKKYSIPLMCLWVFITVLSFANVLDFQNYFYLDFIFNKFNIEFALGMLSGFLVSKKQIVHPVLVLCVGVVLFMAAGIELEFGPLGIDRVLSFGIASFFVVYGAACMDSRMDLKTPKIMMLFGDASYSIYLTHYPAIVVLGKVANSLGVGTLLTIHLIVISTLAAGCVFHLMVEKPLLRLFRSRRKQAPLVAEAA